LHCHLAGKRVGKETPHFKIKVLLERLKFVVWNAHELSWYWSNISWINNCICQPHLKRVNFHIGPLIILTCPYHKKISKTSTFIIYIRVKLYYELALHDAGWLISHQKILHLNGMKGKLHYTKNVVISFIYLKVYR
jgi:hypothetical protein